MAGDHLLTKKYWRRELNASYFDGCMHDARVRSPGARPACTLETEEEYATDPPLTIHLEKYPCT